VGKCKFTKVDRVVGEQMVEELKSLHVAGWDSSKKAIGDMYRWDKTINDYHLIIRYLKDKMTGEYVTEGIFWDVSKMVGGRRWLIQRGRKFELDPQLTPWHDWRHEEGDFVVTGKGLGKVIDDDVSTPEKMAAYLEKLAG
jgi:hypothetical protein